MSKYNSKKVEYQGMVFDSKLECTYYVYLKELEQQGKIHNLQRQIKYQLLPRQTDSKGKFKFHPVEYVSDFEYDAQGVHHVIDTKGFKTPDFRLKQKLFYYNFKNEIECILYKDVIKVPEFKETDKNMKKYFKSLNV